MTTAETITILQLENIFFIFHFLLAVK